ncbi:MAG TPA: thiamine-phosphate kinase [Ktedonobacteraceae bacterium]|nr:thiamine-phosphate kinase [Ktedonobacteraceae bacterium]
MTNTRPDEFELIARLTQGLSSRPDVDQSVGDDCAVLDMGGNMQLLATCDSQVEDVHFTFATSSPRDIGRKALAINISDIAAMGGEPRYALISLILPSRKTFRLEVLDAIYSGLRQEAEQFNVAIVGGNVAGTARHEHASLIIDISLLGAVERGHALLRSGARAGDTLFVTGAPGESAAGLFTLLHPELPYPSQARETARAIFRVPRPRVREGRILSSFGPSIVTAMLDISDGLSGDLQHICERSGVGARVVVAQLPQSSALRSIATVASHDPLDWILNGGEDYELLFSVSPGHEETVVKAVQSATGTPVTAIGTICPPEEGMKLVWPGGREETLVPKSWDHLRSSST